MNMGRRKERCDRCCVLLEAFEEESLGGAGRFFKFLDILIMPVSTDKLLVTRQLFLWHESTIN